MGANLLVYKASAGSGKTFTLAVEYMKLLIFKPKAYREILAVTFTNKATAEMKERILSQLHGIAVADKESEAYLHQLLKETNLPASTVRAHAAKALQYLIHDYDHFRIETIDSFFQSIVRHLARELNLGANLTIELDQTKPLSDAVDELINKLDEDKKMLGWIRDYILERIDDDKRWNVSDEIKAFGTNIFDEVYIEKGETLRTEIENRTDYLRHYKQTLGELKDTARRELTDLADEFFNILDIHRLTPDDFSGKHRGICSYFNKLKASDFSKELRNTTVENHLADPKKWATKASGRYDEIVHLASTTLLPLLEKAEQARPNDVRIINSCTLSLKYVNCLQLLSSIDEAVHEENKRKNRFLLSDTNALLRRFVANEDSPFIFEKLGVNLKHIMIDEFQDTSRMQWNNFKFLLLNGLAEGAESFIVGDAKQSIYRWRNGDWRILNGLKDRLDSFPIAERALTVNRRSAGNIIKFNNRFFQTVLDLVNKDDPILKEAYRDVRQERFKYPEEGFVRITLSDNEDYEAKTCKALTDTVEELKAKGIGLKEMAILVRKKKYIPLIADYFDKYTPYKIVSDEAFQLDSSSTVQMLICALRVLSQPEDKISKVQLAIDYQKEVLHNTIGMSRLLSDKLEPYLPEAFLAQADNLRSMPLYELFEKLFKLFDMKEIKRQDAYLCAFYDHVVQYVQENSSELSGFLQYWEEELHTKTIPSGEVEGIRILSVHSSKGLEFQTVLLPFCDWNKETDVKNGNIVWVEPTEKPYNELSILPVEYSSRMKESIYQKDYMEEQRQLWVDNLNLLYVAFTRAKNNLFIYAGTGRKQTVSQWIEDAIHLMVTDQDNPINIRSENSPLIYEWGSIMPPPPKKKLTTTNKLLIEPKAETIRLQSYDSPIEFRQSNQSAEFIRGEKSTTEAYVTEGRLMHQVFSSIRTKDDIDQAIDRLRFEGVIESDAQEKRVRRLTEYALGNPKVQDWYSGRWTLYNECTILYHANGEMQTRRPDRVMIKGDEVVIVDFKFGRRKEEYHLQVDEYRSLLKQMGYSRIKGYLWYIYDNRIEEVKQTA